MPHFKIPCNGWMVHLLPFVITLTALILSAVGSMSCRFLSSNSETTGQNFFGIFAYQISPNAPCVNINFRYDQFELDVANNTTESFALSQRDFEVSQMGAIGSTSAGAAATSLLFISFFRPLPSLCFRFFISAILLVAFSFACVTFRLFDIYWCGGEGDFFDEGTGEYRKIFARCFMEEGGLRMAAAAALYLIAAICVCLMTPPQTAMLHFSRDYDTVPTTDASGTTVGQREVEMATPSVPGHNATSDDEENKATFMEEPAASDAKGVEAGHLTKDNTEVDNL